ncbi:low molecular weight phosphatase family protein [Brevibacterium antiquum]|uniref:arsenate reductase/protein-tyrosine-phosphatase family protein n=1 Tax=Brevibacterium antiquum TaxID=234835 RepID=UPI0018DF38C4
MTTRSEPPTYPPTHLPTDSPTDPLTGPTAWSAEAGRCDRFRILVVCTGNLFRSPLAAGLLQQGLDEVAPGRFALDSAGTEGVAGVGVTDDVQSLAADWGFDLSEFRAKRLHSAQVTNADLVIGMERWHRSQVVTLEPRALRRTFTLREFARIIHSLSTSEDLATRQRWENLVALAQRSRTPAPGGPDFDDVVDPHDDWDLLSPVMTDQMLPGVYEMVDWEYRNSSLGEA